MFLSRTTYDEQGRAEFQTDSLRSDVPSSEITGTRNYYDANGRVWKTERLRGLQISVASSQVGVGESTVVSTGTVQSYSETTFDARGRTVASASYATSDPNSGLTSSTTFNSKGQVTETRQESWNGAGTGKVVFITRTVFDDRDRVLLQTDKRPLPPFWQSSQTQSYLIFPKRRQRLRQRSFYVLKIVCG